MKHKVSLLTGAFLAVASGAFAQTAVTDPVGYITLPITGGGTPASPKLSYIGASLVNKIEVSAVAAASTGASNATFAAGVLPAAGTYGLNSLGQANYYVEIASGPNVGVWTDITANTATTLTLLDGIGANTSAQTLKIRKHHTISSLFGNTEATVQLKIAQSIGQADELLVIDNPTVGSAKTFYFSNDDSDFNGTINGWSFSNGEPAADYVIAPGVGFKVSRKDAAALNIIQVGHVKTGPTVLPIETGLQIVTVPRAVGSAFTLENSALITSGLVGAETFGAADSLQKLIAGAALNFYFSTDDSDFNGIPNGWTNAGNGEALTAPQKELAEGTAVAIRRKTAPFNWVVPAETIAP